MALPLTKQIDERNQIKKPYKHNVAAQNITAVVLKFTSKRNGNYMKENYIPISQKLILGRIKT